MSQVTLVPVRAPQQLATRQPAQATQSGGVRKSQEVSPSVTALDLAVRPTASVLQSQLADLFRVTANQNKAELRISKDESSAPVSGGGSVTAAIFTQLFVGLAGKTAVSRRGDTGPVQASTKSSPVTPATSSRIASVQQPAKAARTA